MITPTIEHARKVLEVVNCGLTSGIGEQIPGKMCVEAAVCYALGLPHGDEPPCVGAAVRDFKIKLNDCRWSSYAARGKGMRKLAIAQLGSDAIDQMEFGRRLFLKSTQKLMPVVFRRCAKDVKEKDKATFLEHANKFEAVKTPEDAEVVVKAASAYAYAYAYASASASAYAHAYTSASASAYFKKNFGDELLKMTGEIALEVLIEMKSPGCEWLHLCEE